MGLLRGLTEFKRAYDLNLRVKNMLPDLYAAGAGGSSGGSPAPDPGSAYCGRSRDLRRTDPALPEMKMTPHHAWQRQIKGEVETIELENLVGRISAQLRQLVLADQAVDPLRQILDPHIAVEVGIFGVQI
jgi:lysine decarboxylase